MRSLLRLLGVVLLVGLWLSAVGAAAWLANQPTDWALYAAALVVVAASFLCVKGVSFCVSH